MCYSAELYQCIIQKCAFVLPASCGVLLYLSSSLTYFRWHMIAKLIPRLCVVLAIYAIYTRCCMCCAAK